MPSACLRSCCPLLFCFLQSAKAGGFRTLQDFSLSAQGNLESEKWYVVYKDFWDSPTYADDFTFAACEGTGDFNGATNLTRSECCLKGAQ